jgi:hypothetical protein
VRELANYKPVSLGFDMTNKEQPTELLDFWTFSIVWYSREHDVSETGSVLR